MMDNLPPFWMLLGLILSLACMVTLLAGLSLLAISVLRLMSRRATIAPVATGRPTDEQTLQGQYPPDEITRGWYES